MATTTRGQLKQFKTLIYEQELDHIAGWVQEYPNLETGGDLFGFWTHSGFPVVQFVLGPGTTSRHNQTSFYQDREHLIKAGEILRQKHGLQHIGEWHSHHQMGLAQPSGGDEQTVFNALRQYKFPKFLLCIANLHSERGILGSKYIVNVGCFLFTPSSPGYQTGSWVVLPDQSPIRQGLSWVDNRSLLNTCTPNKNWKVHQTTLEEQRLISTEPIEISKDIWYSTTRGKALLKEIFACLTSSYSKCEMFRTPLEEIYFTFEQNPNYGYGYVPDKWRVDLPNNFPQSSPKIKVNEGSPSEIKDWNGEFQVVEQIKACIQRYYNGEWRN